MYSFWQTVANTPWWVFALYCYLIWIGFLATQPRVVSIKSFYYLPGSLLVLVCLLLPFFVPLNSNAILWFFVFIPVGLLIGWIHFKLIKVIVMKDTREIYIPGNFILLGLVVILFLSQYIFNYKLSLSADLLKHPEYTNIITSIVGFLIGLMFGRFIYTFKTSKK